MRRSLLLSLLLSLCALSAYAQFKASIQGTIMDSKGGAVAGAKVTVTNQGTGVTRDTVASDEGFYRVTELPPGNYTVTVEAAGFKKSVSNSIVVQAEQPRGFDVTLQIGASSESVTVTATSEALSTENANLGTSISSDEIQRLPQVGRDPYSLLRLTPGIFGDGARQGNGNSSNLPNDSGKGGSNSAIFQIENTVQVSEDGRGTGAQVKVVSKSGTNQFHGTGFFQYQDPNWNAFNKFHGAQLELPSRVNTKFRQFGGSLGGPVWKDKLFFFFSYEGLRSNNQDISTGTWVETPQFRQLVIGARPGSLIAKVLASPGITPRIANVLTSTCAGAGITNTTQCQAVTGGLDIGSPTGATGQYVPLDGAHFAGGG